MLKNILLSTFLLVGALAGKLNGAIFGDDVQLYVGAVGGISALTGEQHALEDNSKARHDSTIGADSGIAGAVLGIQTEFCQDIFIGLQANALYNSLTKKIRTSVNSGSTLPAHETHIKNHFEYGIDARLGMNFCNVMPYIFGGVEAGKFKMRVSNNTTRSSRGLPAGGSAEHSKTLWGPKAGVGVTFPIACNVYLNLEYSYTWFKKFKTSLQDAGDTWHHNVRLNQNMFLLGLNYMF